jgi:hypothetical protein
LKGKFNDIFWIKAEQDKYIQLNLQYR